MAGGMRFGHDGVGGTRRVRVVVLMAVAGVLLLGSTRAAAQRPVEHVDSARAWYDTISVTRPRFARATLGERLALAAFTALALPVGLTVGGLTIMPPTINALSERDETYIGLAIGTGWGFGGDTTQLTYFPKARVQFDLGYYFGRERPFIAHASLLTDVLVASVHPRDFVWLGASGGLGVASDAHSYTPYAEVWLGALNPMGIRYAPLFPMHNLGVRGRLGYDIAASRPWFELAIGLTSTFAY